MARNTPLTEDVVDKISGLHSSNKDWSAKQVAYELRRQLGKERSKNFTWPADVTVRQWIKKIDEKTSDEDEPWGLAAAASIPPEALPTVVGQWKACMATETPFTKRHAKWTARLYPLVSGPGQLHVAVNLYVERERTSDAMEIRLDTAALDAWLTMAPWEARTAFFTRRVQPLAEAGSLRSKKGLGSLVARYDPSLGQHVLGMAIRKVWLDRVALGKTRVVVGSREHVGVSIANKVSRILEKIGPKLLDPGNLKGSMQPVGQVPWVYVHWLMSVARLAHSLTDDECESMMMELADWVVEHRRTIAPTQLELASAPEAQERLFKEVKELLEDPESEEGKRLLREVNACSGGPDSEEVQSLMGQAVMEQILSKVANEWEEDPGGNPMFIPYRIMKRLQLGLASREKKGAK